VRNPRAIIAAHSRARHHPTYRLSHPDEANMLPGSFPLTRSNRPPGRIFVLILGAGLSPGRGDGSAVLRKENTARLRAGAAPANGGRP